MPFKHLCLILFVAIFAFVGCDKKDEFSLIAESTELRKPHFELLYNGISQIKLHLRDVAGGNGRVVKIELEGLPSEVQAKLEPGPKVIVTDAGVDVTITLTATNAIPDTFYPLTLTFTWEDGNSTWQFPLYVAPYNAAKALAGSYTCQNRCDSASGYKRFVIEIIANENYDRIKFRNFANLGDNVYIDAIVDSPNRRIVIPQQTIGDLTLSAEGSYRQYYSNSVSLYTEFKYPAIDMYGCWIDLLIPL